MAPHKSQSNRGDCGEMKQIIKKNIRVEVEPGVKLYRYNTDEEQIRDCEEMVSQIKRHVDNALYVSVEWDTLEVCSFCGYDWDTDKETGEPFCCQKAIEEWQNTK